MQPEVDLTTLEEYLETSVTITDIACSLHAIRSGFSVVENTAVKRKDRVAKTEEEVWETLIPLLKKAVDLEKELGLIS